MGLQTLEEFLRRTDKCNWPGNAYVEAPGFESFYVRRTSRILNGGWVDHVLDLANITAEVPGQGAFTKLAAELLERGIPLFVECVHNPRFVKTLERLGFTRIDQPGAPSFFKLPEETHATHLSGQGG